MVKYTSFNYSRVVKNHGYMPIYQHFYCFLPIVPGDLPRYYIIFSFILINSIIIILFLYFVSIICYFLWIFCSWFVFSKTIVYKKRSININYIKVITVCNKLSSIMEILCRRCNGISRLF
jgi:hypothetical protein